MRPSVPPLSLTRPEAIGSVNHRLTKDNLCLPCSGMNSPVATLRGVVRQLQQAFDLPVGPSLPRSVRYWATEGLLRPSGLVHTGKGRSRTFGPDEILRAAILFEFAKWDITVGTMKVILQKIYEEQGKLGLVEFVKQRPGSYISFSFFGWPPQCQIVNGRSMPKQSRSMLSIDLTKLVSDLRL